MSAIIMFIIGVLVERYFGIYNKIENFIKKNIQK
jgi:hypothetical protein